MDCGLLSGLVAEKLTKHTGGELSRVFFCNSGTETIEGAIKFARCYTGRQDIVYCDHAFHGLTTGSLALNGADFFRERFGELMPGTQKVPFNDLAALEQALSAQAGGARSSSSRCRARAAKWWPTATWPRRSGSAASTARCWSSTKCSAGLGRTGKWFCFQHWPDVEPDIVCTAKALSGGYVPVGAVITRPKIMDCVFNSMERCVVHSNTFGQNDMAMAAALASLYVIEEDKLVENAAAMGEYAMTQLSARSPSLPVRLRRPRQGADVRHRLRPARRSRSS